MPIKPSDNEDEYFAREEARLRLGLKAQHARSEAETLRCTAVAEKVGSDKVELGEALIDLGFTADDVAILPLLPMLEVAWADGSMSYKESTLILNTARERGLDATTAAYGKLKALTETQPSAEFFHGVNRVYAELLRDKGVAGAAEKASTLELMNHVAHASGGFFGLTSSVSDEERKAIAELIDELSLSR